MTGGAELPRPAPAFRLGVVGNRDLQDADKGALTATVTRFLTQLRAAIDTSLTELSKVGGTEPYIPNPPRLFLVDSLAEGADQLVAEAAISAGHGYRIRCPIPFATDVYKAFFAYDREASIAAYDRITHEQANDPIIVELTCSSEPAHRSDGYAAAADIILDNSDLLFAIYDFARSGREGGTVETVEKGLAAGLPVVAIDLRDPGKLVVPRGQSSGDAGEAVTPDVLQDIVGRILLPPGANAGLQRYLREPLIAGGGVTRFVLRSLNQIYGAFWSAIPTLGAIGAALQLSGHRAEPRANALPSAQDPERTRIIDEVQRPYRERMAPVDALAGFYMKFYRGSFVMNFVFGAFAVLFGLLSYFNHAHMAVWLRAEIVALGVILINFIGSRLWDWHGRALDYRFIAEYLRQMAMLAPLGRSAPSIRPAAQYHGHDPTDTWMGWYVRALDRDHGLIDFESRARPTVLQMDEAFLDTMRSRLCREWLLGQLQYYQTIERRFEGAITVFRALMFLLFAITAVGVGAHLMHFTIALDVSSWREDAVLTIILAALPAFLGALHGIAVQGELEVTAERAGDMTAHLANVILVMTCQADAKSGTLMQLSDEAVHAARMMLEEVLDWRIIHQAHEVELT